MSPPDVSPAQQKKSSAILEAARQHFALHGFEATKLSEVARDAGVAVGTIYLRYDSKAELLGGVLGSVEEAFCDAIDAPEIWSTPFPDRFGAIVAATFEAASRQTHLAELMTLSGFAGKPANERKSLLLGKIEEHIRDGIRRGEMIDDVDPALAAWMAHGMVDGAMRELMANAQRDPADTISHIATAYARWLAK